jgi:hypothetical protein
MNIRYRNTVFIFILILHHHSTFPSHDMFRPTGPSSGEFTNAKILHKVHWTLQVELVAPQE